jgi:hypothetical protein
MLCPCRSICSARIPLSFESGLRRGPVGLLGAACCAAGGGCAFCSASLGGGGLAFFSSFAAGFGTASAPVSAFGCGFAASFPVGFVPPAIQVLPSVEAATTI